MVTIAFFGTPEFAVPSLETLCASSHPVIVVITQPDRPSGRGQRIRPPAVKRVALVHGIPVWQPARLSEAAFLDGLSSLQPDLGVVVAYGRILPTALLDLPRLGFVNLHASLLPHYRGASPVHHAILEGEGRTGVTTMRVVPALDAGPIFASASRPIGLDETSVEVERDLAHIGARLLRETVDAIAEGRARAEPQDDRVATYAPRLTKHDGLIDWSAPARRIHDRVRGLWPWPHAYTFLGGERLVLLRTAIEPVSAVPGRPGEIVEAHGDRLSVAAGDGTKLLILSVQPEGRRAMSAREFLAGHRPRPGDNFTQSPDAPPLR